MCKLIQKGSRLNRAFLWFQPIRRRRMSGTYLGIQIAGKTTMGNDSRQNAWALTAPLGLAQNLRLKPNVNSEDGNRLTGIKSSLDLKCNSHRSNFAKTIDLRDWFQRAKEPHWHSPAIGRNSVQRKTRMNRDWTAAACDLGGKSCYVCHLSKPQSLMVQGRVERMKALAVTSPRREATGNPGM